MLNFTLEEQGILNPTLWINGFQWREPITTLTDQLTALVCLYAFIRFSSYKGEKSESFNYYRYFFLFFAIGMTSAAWFGHGLQAYLSFGWKTIGWTMSAIGFTLVEIATLKDVGHLLPTPIKKLLYPFVLIQFIVFINLMHLTHNFIFPQINSTVSLVFFTLPLHLYAFIKTRHRPHIYIVLTIAYAALPGFIYNNQISLSNWFNYHDISHVLMAIYMALFYFSTSSIAFLDKKAKVG